MERQSCHKGSVIIEAHLLLQLWCSIYCDFFSCSISLCFTCFRDLNSTKQPSHFFTIVTRCKDQTLDLDKCTDLLTTAFIIPHIANITNCMVSIFCLIRLAQSIKNGNFNQEFQNLLSFEKQLLCLFILVTIMCLSIGTPKIINSLFVPNGKLIIFRYPKIRPITA